MSNAARLLQFPVKDLSEKTARGNSGDARKGVLAETELQKHIHFELSPSKNARKSMCGV